MYRTHFLTFSPYRMKHVRKHRQGNSVNKFIYHHIHRMSMLWNTVQWMFDASINEHVHWLKDWIEDSHSGNNIQFHNKSMKLINHHQGTTLPWQLFIIMAPVSQCDIKWLKYTVASRQPVKLEMSLMRRNNSQDNKKRRRKKENKRHHQWNKRKYVEYITMKKRNGMNKFTNLLHMFREH